MEPCFSEISLCSNYIADKVFADEICRKVFVYRVGNYGEKIMTVDMMGVVKDDWSVYVYNMDGNRARVSKKQSCSRYFSMNNELMRKLEEATLAALKGQLAQIRKRNYYRSLPTGQLIDALIHQEEKEEQLREKIFLLSGCEYFGELEGDAGCCVDCSYDNKRQFKKCRKFRDTVENHRRAKEKQKT